MVTMLILTIYIHFVYLKKNYNSILVFYMFTVSSLLDYYETGTIIFLFGFAFSNR